MRPQTTTDPSEGDQIGYYNILPDVQDIPLPGEEEQDEELRTIDEETMETDDVIDDNDVTDNPNDVIIKEEIKVMEEEKMETEEIIKSEEEKLDSEKDTDSGIENENNHKDNENNKPTEDNDNKKKNQNDNAKAIDENNKCNSSASLRRKSVDSIQDNEPENKKVKTECVEREKYSPDDENFDFENISVTVNRFNQDLEDNPIQGEYNMDNTVQDYKD